MSELEERYYEQSVVLYEKQEIAPASTEDLTLLTYKKLEDRRKELHAELRAVRETLYEKYPSSAKKKKPLCPKLRKGFLNGEQLVHYFQSMPDTYRGKINASKFNLIKQFLYGLRVGEVETATYNPYTRLVRVETLKQGQVCIDYLPFIEGTEKLFEMPKVSKDCLRNYFVRHCKRLGPPYNELYYQGKCGGLQRLTSSSLRVTSGNLLRKHTGDPYKQKYHLRHSLNRIYGATSHYMEYPEEEYREELNATMRPFVELLL